MPESVKDLADLGGWVAFLIVTIWGGRSAMSLARSFASDVVAEMRYIKDAIGEQRATIDSMEEQLDRIEKRL